MNPKDDPLYVIVPYKPMDDATFQATFGRDLAYGDQWEAREEANEKAGRAARRNLTIITLLFLSPFVCSGVGAILWELMR
jgi:hypothetical protein